jgi:hypothetical protein
VNHVGIVIDDQGPRPLFGLRQWRMVHGAFLGLTTGILQHDLRSVGHSFVQCHDFLRPTSRSGRLLFVEIKVQCTH